MNLLITPAFTINDEQREQLEKQHRLFFLQTETTPLKEQEIDFCADQIEGIVCNSFFLHNHYSVLPNLCFVQATSAGMEHIPVEQLKRNQVAVFSAGSTYAIPMAEWAICKTLEIYKKSICFYNQKTRHVWEKQRDIRELSGATAVIIGFGNVGRGIATRLKAFGVRIISIDLFPDTSLLSDKWYHIQEMLTALPQADIVYITLPLNEQTRHLIDNEKLERIPDMAALINIARGAIIDESALIRHLQAGRFSGVALDVFEEEPLPANSPLWDMERVLISPHNSFAGDGNKNRLFSTLTHNLATVIDPMAIQSGPN